LSNKQGLIGSGLQKSIQGLRINPIPGNLNSNRCEALFYEVNSLLQPIIIKKSDCKAQFCNVSADCLFQNTNCENYVQYESLETISPSDYFEKVYQKYQEQLNNQLADIQNREAELAKKEDEVNKMLTSLTEIENSWKEQKLKEELNKVQDTVSLTRLNDIVDTFSNSDPAQLTRLMNADNMSVDTLALVFSKLTPDTRAEMLQKLTSVNPQKAAQIVEKMGGVDQIISDIDFKVEELKIRSTIW